MKNRILIFIALFLFQHQDVYAVDLELKEFQKKMENLEKFESFKPNTPEALFFSTLDKLNSELGKDGNTEETIEHSLTLLETTDFIEEKFPKQTEVKFPENFLVGSNLSVADLENASFFLNSLQANQLRKLKDIEGLSENSSVLGSFNLELMQTLPLSPADLIEKLEAMPELDLVALSAEIDGATSVITATTQEMSSKIDRSASSLADSLSQSGDQISQAASQLQSATQIMSRAAGAAMAAASYSLDQAASEIANTISAGVTVDLEAASQGMGYDSFSDAVDAYNSQYGTNYTVDSAREALGQ